MTMMYRSARRMKMATFANTMAPRALYTTDSIRTVSLNRLPQKTWGKASTDLRPCISERSRLLAQTTNYSPSLVPQLARASHGSSIYPGLATSWQQAYRIYQTVYESCWGEAWDSNTTRQRYLKYLGEEQAERLYKIGSRSALELRFEEITADLLYDLGLITGSRDVGWRGREGEINSLIPRITLSNVFRVLNYVTAPERRLKLYPLGSSLPAITEVLGRKFVPLDYVQRLITIPLLPDPLVAGDVVAETAAAYRIVTAYLFFTAATPEDTFDALFQSSNLPRKHPYMVEGGGEGDGRALATEYFHFLRLFLELCEHDDILRGIGDTVMVGEILGRQSRRVLMGKLDTWFTLNQVEGQLGSQIPSGNSASDQITWTEEQERITESDIGVGKLLKVVAFAGTGKTRCTIEYARTRPGTRILYVVFNVSARGEAKRKFGPNVDCKTLHSLAAGVIREVFPQFFTKGITRKFGPGKILGILKIDDAIIRDALINPHGHASPGIRQLPLGLKPFPSAYSVARVVHASLFSYMSSTDVEIGYGSLHWIMANNLGLKGDIVLGWIKLVWEEMSKGRFSVPHNAYIKALHLQAAQGDLAGGIQGRCKADIMAFGKYDIIIFDEAQDASPLMADIILRQRPYLGVFVVGDPYQMIYGFMGANNVCFDDTIYPPTYKLSLTHSFRFGANISALANQFLDVLREPSRIKPAGGMDIIRRNFLDTAGTSLFCPATFIKTLQPQPTNGSGSGKYTRIFQTNNSLISSLFSYCKEHPNDKVHLLTAGPFNRNNLFSLAKSGYDLFHGKSADTGILKGFKSWEALTRSTQARLTTEYAMKRLRLLFEAAISEDHIDAETRKLLMGAMKEDPLPGELKIRLHQVLDRHPPPNLKEFVQAVLSKEKKEIMDQQLSLIVGLEARFAEPDFLETIELCKRMVIHPEDQDTADITMVTAHQAKGLEWDRVELSDEFLPYWRRGHLGMTKDLREECYLMYVAITRARKELIVGPRIAAWLAARRGSFRFFWSYGECPVCRDQGADHCGSATGSTNHTQTHRELLGFEPTLPLGNFGAVIKAPNELKGLLFGDGGVIGCRHCVASLYRAGGDGRKCDLERFVDRPQEVLDEKLTKGGNEDGVPGMRKRWLEMIERAVIADSKRVEDWERGYMHFIRIFLGEISIKARKKSDT